MSLYKIKLSVVLISLLIVSDAHAQKEYSLAICSNGILAGGYNSTLHSIPDTISKEEANSIFMIDGLWIDKNHKTTKLKVIDYQMTIYDQSDSIIIKGNSALITPEMKLYLNKIKPGAKLFFEGIHGAFPDGSAWAMDFIPFIIR